MSQDNVPDGRAAQAYGEILSSRVLRSQRGIGRGRGFILYDSPEAASRAIAAVHDQTVWGLTFCALTLCMPG